MEITAHEALRPGPVRSFTHKNSPIGICNIKNPTGVPKQDISGIQASESKAELVNISAQFSNIGNAEPFRCLKCCLCRHPQVPLF